MLLLFSLRAVEEGTALRLPEMVVAREGKKRLAAVVPVGATLVAIQVEAIQVGVILAEKHLSLHRLLFPAPKIFRVTCTRRCTLNTVIQSMANRRCRLRC